MTTKRILASLTLLVLSVIGFYLWHFKGHPISPNPSDWGPFGDFFGGILNPIIAGAGLLLLLRTITQNEKALIQAKEMIEQGNTVIKQNAEELKSTREEVKQAREAQQQLANIESINLKVKNTHTRQKHYEEIISVKSEEINALLNMNVICGASEKKTSFSKYLRNYEPITLDMAKNEVNALYVIMQAIHKSIELCIQISNVDLLNGNPLKEDLININKSKHGIFLIDICDLAETLNFYHPTKNMNGRATEFDDNYKKLVHVFCNTIIKHKIRPYFDHKESITKSFEFT